MSIEFEEPEPDKLSPQPEFNQTEKYELINNPYVRPGIEAEQEIIERMLSELQSAMEQEESNLAIWVRLLTAAIENRPYA